jgi:hypothetical protein
MILKTVKERVKKTITIIVMLVIKLNKKCYLKSSQLLDI